MLPLTERALHLGGHGGRGRHAVELDAVARADHRELAQPGQAGELGPQRLGRLGRQRQPLAHGQWRGVVGRPEDKKVVAAHLGACTAGFGSLGWRLLSTGQSEMRAAAKSPTRNQENRFASSSPWRRMASAAE